MIIYKSYKIRIYPTKEQEEILMQHMGNTRFLWNKFLELNQKEYEINKKFIYEYELNKIIHKLKEEFPFLTISIAQSLQQVSKHLSKALTDFNNHNKGFPKFKKKSKRIDSFTIPQYFKLNKKYVQIPKIGKVKWKKHTNIKGKPKFITIKHENDQWFCSVTCKLKVRNKNINLHNDVGIDVGIKTYAVLTDESEIENPKILKKYERKLKKQQRKLSKRKAGSKNREKQRKKVAKIHKKIANSRKNFQHEKTHDIINKYDVVFLEDLNIAGMMKNHKLAKAVQDCAWHEFKRQLKYKCLWNRKICLEIERFEPTSKTCFNCKNVKKDLKLSDRTYVCDKCNVTIDRDLNAALNIRERGRTILWGTQELTTLVEMRSYRTLVQCSSVKQEQEVVNFDPCLVNVGSQVTKPL